MHNELLRIGFLEFVAKMKKIAPKNKDNKRIFFTLKPNTRGEYSAQPSKWFGKMLDDLGLKQKGLCFHSWRHIARTILRNNNCPIDRVQLIQIRKQKLRRQLCFKAVAGNISQIHEQHSKTMMVS